jgi:hypothetical protein
VRERICNALHDQEEAEMGMLFRMLAPKPLKKARRVAHPVSMVTPRQVKRAKMAAVNTANPAGAAKRAAKRTAVREVRGSGKSVGRVLSPAASGQVGVVAAAAVAGRGIETGAPLMELASDQHRVEYERIKGWVAQMFGEAAQPAREDLPSFQVRSGSETIFIHLIGDDDVLMNLRAWPCDRLKVPDSALRRMLEFNAHCPVGALVVEDLGEAEFTYSTLSENLTKESFEFLFHLFARYASEARAELKPFVT